MSSRPHLAADRAYRVEALAKGLKILKLFSDRRPSLRLKDVAELTGIPMPTVFRLVATLVDEGYIERFADGAIRPGTEVLTLGFAALHGLDLVQMSSVVLRRLADETMQTVNLGVLSGDRILYVARLASNALVGANVTVGSTLPAVVTSMGKMMLAYLSPDELDRRLDAASFAGTFGPNAVQSRDRLNEQLAGIRRDGYALQNEELSHGLRSIAGPVRNASGAVIAAVNIAVPSAECAADRLVERFHAPLLSACVDISRRLGASA
jgi:IclR family pca regulon transcriptional regulator